MYIVVVVFRVRVDNNNNNNNNRIGGAVCGGGVVKIYHEDTTDGRRTCIYISIYAITEGWPGDDDEDYERRMGTQAGYILFTHTHTHTHTHTLAAHRDGVPSLYTATRGDSDQYNTNAQPGLSEDRSKNGGATTTTVRGNTRRFLQKARAAPRPYLRPTHYAVLQARGYREQTDLHNLEHAYIIHTHTRTERRRPYTHSSYLSFI